MSASLDERTKRRAAHQERSATSCLGVMRSRLELANCEPSFLLGLSLLSSLGEQNTKRRNHEKGKTKWEAHTEA